MSVSVRRQVQQQAVRMQSGETGAITGCESVSVGRQVQKQAMRM